MKLTFLLVAVLLFCSSCNSTKSTTTEKTTTTTPSPTEDKPQMDSSGRYVK